VDKIRWMIMQYQVSPTNVLWSPKDAWPYNCGRRMAIDNQNF